MKKSVSVKGSAAQVEKTKTFQFAADPDIHQVLESSRARGTDVDKIINERIRAMLRAIPTDEERAQMRRD